MNYSACFLVCVCLPTENGFGVMTDLRVKGQSSRKEIDLGQETDLKLRNGPTNHGMDFGDWDKSTARTDMGWYGIWMSPTLAVYIPI